MLKPNYTFHRITDIPVSFFTSRNIKGLILDVDNTLTTHDNPTPLLGLDTWFEQIKAAGISMIILSNNSDERVKPFAKMLSLDYIADGKKPLTSGLKRAANVLKLDKSNVALVGDQLFTDIAGGNLWGCLTVLVEPIELENKPFFKFKRALEKIILK